MKIVRRLIRVNGEEVDLLGPQSIDAIRKMICADTLDVVLLKDRYHIMLIDDDGHEKGLTVNDAATQIYRDVCRRGAMHNIVGDVVVVPDSDYEEES